MVTEGSYIVAMDGAQGQVSDIPRGKPEWAQDNPLPAIRDFLASHPEFVSDPHYTRLHVTSNPNGYLRRLPDMELHGR
jgi:cephalosporin hydroxylase